MNQLPECSVDSVIAEMPLEGIGIELWVECLRVLKPGGHVIAISEPRQYHRVAVAIEDAGFEVRDQLIWLHKRHNSAVLARKPLEGTVASNVLKYGVGAMNIDASRVGAEERTYDLTMTSGNFETTGGGKNKKSGSATVTGRWPANVMISHLPECRIIGQAPDSFGGGSKATLGFVNGYEHDGWTGQVVSSPIYECAEGCPALDFPSSKDGVAGRRNAGVGMFDVGSHEKWGGFGGSGSAARFFQQLPYTEDEIAHLSIVLGRKPLDGTVAANVLEHGVGGINIDASRIEATGENFDNLKGRPITKLATRRQDETDDAYRSRVLESPSQQAALDKLKNLGRWPANVLHDGSDAVLADFPVSKDGVAGKSSAANMFGVGVHERSGGYGGSGSAARFFATAPKPISLFRYLVKLITPLGGVVLDPFDNPTIAEAISAEGMTKAGDK